MAEPASLLSLLTSGNVYVANIYWAPTVYHTSLIYTMTLHSTHKRMFPLSWDSYLKPVCLFFKSTMTTTKNSCLVKFDSNRDPLCNQHLWVSLCITQTLALNPHHLGIWLAVVTHEPECKLQRRWNLLVSNKHDTCEGPQYFVKDSRDLAWETNHTASRDNTTGYSKQK